MQLILWILKSFLINGCGIYEQYVSQNMQNLSFYCSKNILPTWLVSHLIFQKSIRLRNTLYQSIYIMGKFSIMILFLEIFMNLFNTSSICK